VTLGDNAPLSPGNDRMRIMMAIIQSKKTAAGKLATKKGIPNA
jgi:hypothetical protein